MFFFITYYILHDLKFPCNCWRLCNYVVLTDDGNDDSSEAGNSDGDSDLATPNGTQELHIVNTKAFFAPGYYTWTANCTNGLSIDCL